MGHQLSLAASIRSTFGASYPATYEFSIPEGSSDLRVQYRYQQGNYWRTLPERSGASMASGEDAVRFDYPANRAWVSVAFDYRSTRNIVQLRIVNTAGTEVVSTYVSVPKFYNNRTAVCVVSWDDWAEPWHTFFVKASEACRDRGLWCSVGINAGGVLAREQGPLTAAQWTDIQALVDDGYLEPNNHGIRHRNADTFPDYDDTIAEEEVDQGVDAIVNNLALPRQSRMGAAQFVLGWIEPHGQTNSFVQDRLASAGLLNQRRSNDGVTTTNFAEFESEIGVYGRQSVVSNADDRSPEVMNGRFDTALSNGGIYHVYGHPWLEPGNEESWTGSPGEYDWDNPDDPIFEHLDYISGRENVWYVGWGHLYMYRHIALNVAVATVDTTGGSSPSAIRDGAAVPAEVSTLRSGILRPA